MVLAMAAGVGHVAWWMAAHNIIAALSRMRGVREGRMLDGTAFAYALASEHSTHRWQLGLGQLIFKGTAGLPLFDCLKSERKARACRSTPPAAQR